MLVHDATVSTQLSIWENQMGPRKLAHQHLLDWATGKEYHFPALQNPNSTKIYYIQRMHHGKTRKRLCVCVCVSVCLSLYI